MNLKALRGMLNGLGVLPYIIIHLLALGAFFYPVTWPCLVLL